MRADIQAAYELLDKPGRRFIDGVETPSSIRRAYRKLEEFFPNEKVLALASGFDPKVGIGQKLAMGGVASVQASITQANSGRLLVLTELNFYEIVATGRLNGNKLKFARIALGHIVDVRVLSERKLTRKERFLMVDHMRGANIETETYSVSSDNELSVLPPLLKRQAAIVGEMMEKQRREAQAPVVVAQEVSIADELLKLKGLMDARVITSGEFEAQKARLLARNA